MARLSNDSIRISKQILRIFTKTEDIRQTPQFRFPRGLEGVCPARTPPPIQFPFGRDSERRRQGFSNSPQAVFPQTFSRFALLEYLKGIDSQIGVHWSPSTSRTLFPIRCERLFPAPRAPFNPLARIDSASRSFVEIESAPSF